MSKLWSSVCWSRCCVGMVEIIPKSDVGLSLDCENFSPRFFLPKHFYRSVVLGLARLSVKSKVDLMSLTSSIRGFHEEGCCVHVIRF